MNVLNQLLEWITHNMVVYEGGYHAVVGVFLAPAATKMCMQTTGLFSQLVRALVRERHGPRK